MLSIKTKLFNWAIISLITFQVTAQQPKITKQEAVKCLYIYSDSSENNKQLYTAKGFIVVSDYEVMIPGDSIKGTKPQLRKGREATGVLDQNQKPLPVGRKVWLTQPNNWQPDVEVKEDKSWYDNLDWGWVAFGVVALILIILLRKLMGFSYNK